MTDRPTLRHLSFPLQGLMNDRAGLDLLPSLNAEPPPEFAELYAGVLQELRTIGGKIVILMMELVSPSQWTDSADQTLNNIRIWLDPLNHCSVCLYQKVGARMKRPTCLPLIREKDISIDDNWPSN